jgi:signal transduction histidine kinase
MHVAEPDLTTYEQRAFARHFAFDLHFPLAGVAVLTLVCAWLMHGRVANPLILAWLAFSVLANLAREGFMWHTRPRLESHQRHAAVLRAYTWSSLASGLTWGAFVWLYVDPAQPLTQLVAGSIVAGLIGVSVTPLSIHLPAFYTFVLPLLAPYLVVMVLAGGAERLTLAAMAALYLGAMANYAHATHRVHRENIRLRFEKQQLIDDLTVRKAEAENAARIKGLFLAGVSHDLKQPVRAISLYTGFLKRTELLTLGEDRLRDTVHKIETAAGDIHSQITRLLELSRLESGTAPVHLSEVNLSERLCHMVELASPDAHARGIELCVRTGSPVTLTTDVRMLDSIIQNLLGNALKHAQATRVLVAVRHQHTGVRVEIRDNGQGIAPERLPQLFEAYRSFDDRQASDSHGLGLAIVRAQAGYLGAQITVRSAVGQGSVFALEGLG